MQVERGLDFFHGEQDDVRCACIWDRIHEMVLCHGQQLRENVSRGA